jgi:hypothetical protein
MPPWLSALLVRLGLSATRDSPATEPQLANLPPSTASDMFRSGIASLRSTAVWLFAVFAAVGGILIAGIQLSSIGRLELQSFRMLVAIVAAVVALGAIGIILWLMVRVLAPDHVTLAGLKRDEINNPDGQDSKFITDAGLLGPYASVGKLQEAYDAAATAERQRETDAQVQLVLGGVRYYRLRRHFKQSVIGTVLAAMLAAVAIGGFAWAANPKAEQVPKFQVPVEAKLRLSDAAKASMADEVGQECVKSDILVIVLTAAQNEYDVVTIPNDKCRVTRFMVGPGPAGVEGHLAPVMPALSSPTG